MEQSLCLVKCVPKWAPSAQTAYCFLIECGRSNLWVGPSPAGPFVMLDVLVYGLSFFPSSGESVDDCGGGYSESIAEMCEELQNGLTPLLIVTPNGRDESGANRDCFLLNPTAKSPLHMSMFRFLGIILLLCQSPGVLIRDKQKLKICMFFLLKSTLCFYSCVLGQPRTLHFKRICICIRFFFFCYCHKQFC